MPAPDGGPMLWAFCRTANEPLEYSGVSELTRCGFTDTSGRLVVPLRYVRYQYCYNAAGRVTSVLADAADHLDVLNLKGKVVGRIPETGADCVSDRYAVFWPGGEYDFMSYGEGLFDLRHDRIRLKRQPGRIITMLGKHTANVQDRKRGYFLDLDTGRRTPHPGWVGGTGGYAVEKLLPGTALVPARASRPDENEESGKGPKAGYLTANGRWAAAPKFAQAGAFRDGVAIVTDTAGQMSLIDTKLKPLGGRWANITAYAWGYLAERNEPPTSGRYDRAARLMEQPFTGSVQCFNDSACAIEVPGARPSVGLIHPDGTTMSISPAEGFDHLLSAELADNAMGDAGATQVSNLGTGVTFGLRTEGWCEAVGAAWVSCGHNNAAPAEIRTSAGLLTTFRQVVTIPGVSRDSEADYYQAQAGSEEGLVDANGRWLYRQSSYANLED